jgi:hypothetical protein
MNPLALGLITLGVVLLLFGIFSLLGIIAIATPFVVSYFLAR